MAEEALGHARRHVLDLSANEDEFLAGVKRLLSRGRRRKVFAFASILVALGLVLAGGAVALVRIKKAESAAQEKAEQAEVARQQAEQERLSAIAAAARAQKQTDALLAEQRRREAAEKDKTEAEEKQKRAEAEVKQAKELSREQLLGQLEKTEAAKKKAEKATEDARKEKKRAEEYAKKEHDRAERAEKQLRKVGIITDPLPTNGSGGSK